jgi:Glycosyltransferase family 9 (heptosyltransferase)
VIGIGDEVIATGFARGAAERGKRIAFGDGRQLLWGPWCAEVFKNNPNIATRADEHNIEWIPYYKGHRGYNRLDPNGRRWIWNYEFKAKPGEFFFNVVERARTLRRPGTVLLEPNVPWHKSVAVNKDWGWARYQVLAEKLRRAGWRVLQTNYGKIRLLDVETIAVHSFRDAAAIISSVDLVIVPEGGLHHAAAAVGTRAIVLFGGFIPPQVIGYDAHINLTGGAEACGSLNRCDHCRQALEAIEVDHVYALADAELCQKSTAISARTD